MPYKPKTNKTNHAAKTLQDYKIERIEIENAKRFDKIIQKLDQYNQQVIQTQKEQAIQNEQQKIHEKRIDAIEITQKQQTTQLKEIPLLQKRLEILEETQKSNSTFIKSIAVVVIAQILIAIIEIIKI